MSKKVQNFLEPLQPLLKKANNLSKIAEKIESVIPNNGISPWRLGNYEKGVLTIIAHDAAFATQLKFLCPHLRTYLRKNGLLPDIAQIDVKVIPKNKPLLKPIEKKKRKRIHSVDPDEDYAHIEDEALKSALLKLSKLMSSL